MTDTTDKVAAAAAPAPAAVADTAPDQFALTLEEFCTRHSKIERSVELLAAFFATETRAGRTHGHEADFVERLAAFASRPVA